MALAASRPLGVEGGETGKIRVFLSLTSNVLFRNGNEERLKGLLRVEKRRLQWSLGH